MKKATFVFIAILLVFAVLTAVDEMKGPNIQRVGMDKQITHTPRHTNTRDVDILTEDFASGALPREWQNVDNGSSGDVWEFDNPGARTINTTTNANGFAILDSDHYGNGHTQDADLITCSIDCSRYLTDPIILEFEHYFRSYSGSSATLSVSGDDGASWTVLDTWTASTANAVLASYNISAYASARGLVKIKWNYIGDWGYYWAVDDIRVFAQVATVPPDCSTLIQPDSAETGVDINTSLIWETAEGVPTEYLLYFGTDNPPTNIVNGTDVYPATSYVTSTLDFNQTYYWQVVPGNEHGSATGCPVWSFTTYSPLSLTYTQGFESGAPYWYIINNNGDSQNWTIYSGLPHSGTYSVGINTNTTSAGDDWGILPALDLTGGNTYQISYYEVAADGDQDYSIWWGNSQNPVDMVNPIYSGTLVSDGYNYSGAAYEFTPTGTGPFFIGLHFTSAGTDGTNTYLMIDDVQVQEITAAPDCPVLDSPVGGVTDVMTTPTLEWTHATGVPSGYYLYLGTDYPPTDVINGVDVDYADSYTVTTMLDYETTYYWYVDAYNGLGTSSGCTIESFVTMADQTIDMFPWEEGFENGGLLPNGWTQEYVSGTVSWTCQSGGNSGHPAAAHGGSYNAYLFTTGDATTNLVTPMINFSGASTAFLGFYHTQAIWPSDQDELTVYYKSGPAGSWTQLAYYDSSITDWTYEEIELPDLTETYWIAFSGYVTYGYGVCVDDVSVFLGGTPPGPSTVVAPTDDATDVSAVTNLSWNAASSATGYKLSLWYDDGARATQYICQDKDLGNVFTYDPSDDGVDMLNYDTIYGWTVVPYNEDGDAIDCPEWYFTVESDPSVSSLPWLEDFENGGAIPAGWTQEYTNGSINWIYTDGGHSYHPSSAYSGSYNAQFYYGSSSLDYSTMLVTPPMDLSAYNAVRLEFMHAQAEWPSDQDELTVYYKNSVGGAWNQIAYYPSDTPNWTKRCLDLPNLSSTYWIAFEGMASYGYGVCLDNVEVLESVPVNDAICITEVSDNATGQDTSTGYIEIYNQRPFTLDVSGFQVRVGVGDGEGNFTPSGYAYTIPEGTTISGHGFLLIGGGADYATFTTAWGITEAINYLPGDTQLGLTSGVAYDFYNPFTRAGSMDDTPNVGVDEHVVQTENNTWSAGNSDEGTPGELDGDQTLPVTFATFTAQAVNNENVLLMWTTQSESDMQGYHVYRSELSEIDDEYMVRLTTNIIPANNSSQESSYEFEDSDIEFDVTYYYWVESYENNGYTSFHGPVSTTVAEGDEIVPDVYEVTKLEGNRPNPFNPDTEIHFSLKGTGGEMVNASLVIYNVKGQRVKTFFNERKVSEKDHVVWHGDDDTGKPVASGVYFYRLKTDDYSEIRKMMLLK